jgi:hypothetical protein
MYKAVYWISYPRELYSNVVPCSVLPAPWPWLAPDCNLVCIASFRTFGDMGMEGTKRQNRYVQLNTPIRKRKLQVQFSHRAEIHSQPPSHKLVLNWRTSARLAEVMKWRGWHELFSPLWFTALKSTGPHSCGLLPPYRMPKIGAWTEDFPCSEKQTINPPIIVQKNRKYYDIPDLSWDCPYVHYPSNKIHLSVQLKCDDSE